MYRYLYSNRVRFANSFADAGAVHGDRRARRARSRTTPATTSTAPTTPRGPAATRPNYLDQQSDDHGSAYWKSRDLIAKAQGSTMPLFMTQGFIENNTKPDGA